MADEKTETDNRDHSRVAGDEAHEAQYLTQQTGISTKLAIELIKAYGSDRATLVKVAKGFVKPQVRSSRV